MAARTLAGRLVSAFGDPEAMARFYAPEVRWHMESKGQWPDPIAGKEAVIAFNRDVWTIFYEPDCTVEILDEVEDEAGSAVRFAYRAFAKVPNQPYENEYSVFVRKGPQGITDVFERFDTTVVAQFYAGVRRG
ncbi:nuclear transport factor 2 family protein [Novosphingobium bradum]|uniref:Nuclear transport factor 2 family protein n=1 Tax=Novosphingobium bradum TaxID=1737444 RepID=A0ABV7ILJ3_9SPHN